MTAALEGEWSATRPGRTLPAERTRYPLYRRLGGPQGRSGEVRKISPPPGFDPRPSSPYPVAIPTEIPDPHTRGHTVGIMSNTLGHAFGIISYTRCYTVGIMQNIRGHAVGMKFYTRGCTDGIIRILNSRVHCCDVFHTRLYCSDSAVCTW